mmetsp:Transcript_23518/g.50325  ORF Transcript_23518/g.50325 Transcript_23518/m.50325 type:complete len:276 (-) Transcript_23518:765-1592(-)
MIRYRLLSMTRIAIQMARPKEPPSIYLSPQNNRKGHKPSHLEVLSVETILRPVQPLALAPQCRPPPARRQRRHAPSRRAHARPLLLLRPMLVLLRLVLSGVPAFPSSSSPSLSSPSKLSTTSIPSSSCWLSFFFIRNFLLSSSSLSCAFFFFSAFFRSSPSTTLSSSKVESPNSRPTPQSEKGKGTSADATWRDMRASSRACRSARRLRIPGVEIPRLSRRFCVWRRRYTAWIFMAAVVSMSIQSYRGAPPNALFFALGLTFGLSFPPYVLLLLL